MRRLQRPPKPITSRWLVALPAEIYDRLAKLGLVEPRTLQDHPRTILAYMRAYIAGRTDWKKPENHKQSVDWLEKFLPRDLPLGALTKGDAERWHRWMIGIKKLSPNTAGQHVKRCRQMMRAALEDGLIERNPFTGVKIDLSSDTSKNRFIDSDTALALLESCPDQEWRTIFALCRFGGLRCPSEVLALRWSDIVWDRDRFKVRASTTARYGKGERVVPLFPELRAELDALYAIAEPGVLIPTDAYVIQSFRCTEVNLRKAIHKIADNAGVERWPKPFIALRASRRTELERSGRFANHVLNDWFGHTGKIAETYYLQTTEADFELAADSVVPSVVPSLGRQEPHRSVTKQKNPGNSRVVMAGKGSSGMDQYTQMDSNH
ncbi:MAG: tyrosine-type recombinase/integrase [Aureliella sp.]